MTIKQQLCKAYNRCKERIAAHKNQTKMKQQQTQQCIRQQYIFQQMMQLQAELFDVMHSNNYGSIQTISTSGSIRISNYKIQNNRLTYSFALTKSTSDRLPFVLQNQLMQNINTDIDTVRNQIASAFGEEYLAVNYPFLFTGVTVVAVHDSGGMDVVIDVIVM